MPLTSDVSQGEALRKPCAYEQETMRIYPAAGGASMRRSKTGKDVVLGNGKLVVPAGVALHMPITAVHHNEAIWENAKAFIPERFLEVGHFCQAYPTGM